jgi:hypothetical protein
MAEMTYNLWDLKYAMLIQRLQDGISPDDFTDEEKELFRYCVKEGFLDITTEDGEEWKGQ